MSDPGRNDPRAQIDPSAQIAAGAHVEVGAELGAGVVVGAGAVIQAGARIGAGCEVGPAAVILALAALGEDCVVEPGAVLGKTPRLRPGSSAATDEPPRSLQIESRVRICAGAVVYAGAWIGESAIVGDQAQVRERSRLGAHSVLGRASCLDFDARIGQRVSVQTGVYVTAGTVVEDDVFLGPGVTTANDHAMGRHARGEPLAGPCFRRACRVGAGVVVVPGVTVGEEAFIAAGAVVTADVEPRAVMMGVPARRVRTVPDEDLLERWRRARGGGR